MSDQPDRDACRPFADRALGAESSNVDHVEDDLLWAGSGAMALTGAPSGPPRLGPRGIASGMARLASRFAELSAQLGRTVTIDGPALLGERSAIAGFGRQGSTTVGGAGRMIRAGDGWLALQLPRENDWDLLPALLRSDSPVSSWQVIERMVADIAVDELVEIGRLLGLAIAACRPSIADDLPNSQLSTAGRWVGVRRDRPSAGGSIPTVEGMHVLDLSSLWAGPLCANLLGLAGAVVTKVEDPARPDGARRGPRQFYELLHRGQESVHIDFSSTAGRAELRERMRRADVVIEASRPRVMDQMGISPSEMADGSGVWLSLTARGRQGDHSNTIAFGDDAAVEAGAWLRGESPPRSSPRTEATPYFVGDALADPVAGLSAAVAVLESLSVGGGEVIEVSLVGAVRALISPDQAASSSRVERRADGSWWVISDDFSAPVAMPRARRQ